MWLGHTQGPLVASILAAAQLKRENKLKTNVVFLIEGGEESGTGMKERGLEAIVQQNLHWFPNVAVRELESAFYSISLLLRSTKSCFFFL